MSEQRAWDREATAQIEGALEELQCIADLPSLLDPAFGWMGPEKRRDYHAFWQKAKEISELFKASRLRHQNRERLWSRHHELCKQVKELQTRERDNRYYQSKQNCEQITSMLSEAWHCANGAKKLDHLTEVRSQLQEAMALMKQRFLLKNDRDDCWKLWREINDMVPAQRRSIHEAHYAAFEEEIDRIANLAAYGNPRDALCGIRELQRQIGPAELSRDQKNHLRGVLQKYWDMADERMRERREEYARRKEESLTGAISRREALVEKNERIVRGLRERIDDLESQIATAWSPGWAEQMTARVQEMYDKISDIEQTNEDLERQIEEIRSKLQE